MSFSSEVKKELCSVEVFDRDALKAELYGMLIFGRKFSADKIIFKTENKYACRRLITLLENLYTPILEKQTDLRHGDKKSSLYKVTVIDSGDCHRIFSDFGHIEGQVTLRVNRANVYSEELSAAFIRGAFLSCGSAANPEKNYHAEFCAPFRNLASDLSKLLSEITECELNPKTVTRSGSYVVYFKGSEQICDLLTYVGAPKAAMEVMGTKAYKQVRNNINRRINGEVANIDKVALASAKQVAAIEHIKRTIGLEALPEDLREIAYLRLDNPEMSLRALGENLNPPISRSGANHRIQRLMEYADITEEQRNG